MKYYEHNLTSDLNFSGNSLIFHTFRNSSVPEPPLGKLGLFFTLLWEVLQPHPPVVSAFSFSAIDGMTESMEKLNAY